MKKNIKKCNDTVNCEGLNKFEYWKEYDENGNMIHYKNSDGVEYWREYDGYDNEIHYKHQMGVNKK